MSIAQIPGRFDRSPATIKGYFYDPTGEGACGQGPLPGRLPRLRRADRGPRR